MQRPDESALAYFYLAISIGGAVGTTIATLVVPVVFQYPLELPVLLCLGFWVALMHLQFPKKWSQAVRRILVYGLPILFLAYTLAQASKFISALVDGSRNFYGTLYVLDKDARNGVGAHREFAHGNITHGIQFLSEPQSKIPTSYFSYSSGVGRALRYRQSATTSEGLSVGVIGLGAGTLAAYCRPEDSFTFYEINPGVIKIANEQFTYLKQCANHTIVEGDARLSMEREQKSITPPRYDMLIIDAFSGDAIPVHLLTKEAFALYRAQLRDERSMLLVHISNSYVELAPVVFGGGATIEMHMQYIHNAPDGSLGSGVTPLGESASNWVILSRASTTIAELVPEQQSEMQEIAQKKSVLWTDDFSNIFSIMKWVQ